LLDRKESPGVFFLEESGEDSSWKNSSEKTQLVILGILPVDWTTDTQEGGSDVSGFTFLRCWTTAYQKYLINYSECFIANMRTSFHCFY